MNFILKQARFCEFVFTEDMLVTIEFILFGEYGKCDFIGVDWTQQSFRTEPIVHSAYSHELYKGERLDIVEGSFMVFGNENGFATGKVTIMMPVGYNYILFNNGFSGKYDSGEMTATISYSPLSPKSSADTGAANVYSVIGVLLLSVGYITFKAVNR